MHRTFPGSMLSAIHNANEERNQFYADRRVGYTGMKNHRICNQRIESEVNSAGYGIADCEIVIDGKPHQKLAVKQPQA